MADMDPITREEMYLSAAAGESVTLPDPITRREKYLAKLAGEDVNTPDPVTREEMFLEAVVEHGGGGGGDITVESLSVTENGEYTAPTGKAYSPVVVDVPSDTPTLITKSVTENGTYDADDDEADGYSSVTVDVPEATLTTKSITANGTYAASGDNADGYSSVTVNVSSGGGASNVVTGTFTGTTTGAAKEITLDYSGNGYPVAVVVYPSEGVDKSGGTFANLIQKLALQVFTAVKNDIASAPTYASDSGKTENQYTALYRYKNSDSSSTAYAQNAKADAITAYGGASEANYTNVRFVTFVNKTKMSVFIASSGGWAGPSYGFAANIPYKYCVIYSE